MPTPTPPTPKTSENRLPRLFAEPEGPLIDEWLQEMGVLGSRDDARMREGELRGHCSQLLAALRGALAGGDDGPAGDVESDRWAPVRELLSAISRSRGLQGFTPIQTASFVLALKAPLFVRLRALQGADADGLFQNVALLTRVIDRLALITTEVYQKTREEVIIRQQQELLELSTPVVKLWDGILALPLIGTLDSARTQVVMETLLQRIVDTGAPLAIIDITGVPTVDTLVAQHLIKTVTAARLMGADCIISGIRPQIAQTIVHLGVELGDITTKASLADALATALRRLGRGPGQHADGDRDGQRGPDGARRRGAPSLAGSRGTNRSTTD